MAPFLTRSPLLFSLALSTVFAYGSAPAQARPQADGLGLVDPAGQAALVGIGPGLERGDYTYYAHALGRKTVGTIELSTIENKLASGRFEEHSLEGREGCKGRFSLRLTSPRSTRAQDMRFNGFWQIEGAVSGSTCSKVGQSYTLQDMRWDRLPQSVVASATAISRGTLTAQVESSRIGLRTQASLGSDTHHYGKVGDRLQMISSTFGQDGYLWYQVKLSSSGAQGWVRGDLVSPDFAGF